MTSCSSDGSGVSNTDSQNGAHEEVGNPGELDRGPEVESAIDLGLRQQDDSGADGSDEKDGELVDETTDSDIDAQNDPTEQQLDVESDTPELIQDVLTDLDILTGPDVLPDRALDRGFDEEPDLGTELDSDESLDDSGLDAVADLAPDRELDSPDETEIRPPVCESYSDPEPAGTLPLVVNEASGLAVSSFDDTILWTHNDSGGRAEVYAVSEEGELLATAVLSSGSSRDWEDLAGGPCADNNDEHCLYVGDIGDNDRVRSSIAVHMFREPDPRDGDVTVDDVQTAVLTYPEGAQNSEALFVDGNGRLFLLTKVWRTSQLFTSDFNDGVLELITSIDLASSTVTGADLRADGSRLLVRTYSNAFEYQLDGLEFDALGEAESLFVPSSAERQGEAIAYGPSGDYWHVSEGDGPSIYHIRCATE